MRSSGDLTESIACDYAPNVFLMSVLLFFATFVMAVKLKEFRNAPVFNAVR